MTTWLETPGGSTQSDHKNVAKLWVNSITCLSTMTSHIVGACLYVDYRPWLVVGGGGGFWGSNDGCSPQNLRWWLTKMCTLLCKFQRIQWNATHFLRVHALYLSPAHTHKRERITSKSKAFVPSPTPTTGLNDKRGKHDWFAQSSIINLWITWYIG